MKRLFLDTNILLDLAEHREHFYDAVQILEGAFEKKFETYANALSYANVAYVLRKLPQERLYQVLSLLTKNITLLPLQPEHVKTAICHPVRDFEDMLQYQCAKAAVCDVIITNNKKDFAEFSDLPVMTAEEFLRPVNG